MPAFLHVIMNLGGLRELCDLRKAQGKTFVPRCMDAFARNAAANSAKSRSIVRATVPICCRRVSTKPRSLEELGNVELLPQVEIGDGFVYEHEHLLIGLSFALAKSARTDARSRTTT